MFRHWPQTFRSLIPIYGMITMTKSMSPSATKYILHHCNMVWLHDLYLPKGFSLSVNSGLTHLHLLVPTLLLPANHGSRMKMHRNVSLLRIPRSRAGLSESLRPFRNQCTVCFFRELFRVILSLETCYATMLAVSTWSLRAVRLYRWSAGRTHKGLPETQPQLPLCTAAPSCSPIGRFALLQLHFPASYWWRGSRCQGGRHVGSLLLASTLGAVCGGAAEKGEICWSADPQTAPRHSVYVRLEAARPSWDLAQIYVTPCM